MNKVLLIMPSPLNQVGGIETYNKYIVDILNKNYNDLEIHIVLKNYCPKVPDNFLNIKYFCANNKYPYNQKNIFIQLKNEIYAVKRARKIVYELNKKNAYDLIIDSSKIYFKKINRQNNYYLVQHFDIKTYIWSIFKADSFRHFFGAIFQHIFLGKFSLFKNISNFIVFDNLNMNLAKKLSKANIEYISLCNSSDENNIYSTNVSNNDNKIIYFGRFDDAQKNIKKLMILNQKINKIDFYGEAYYDSSKLLKKEMIEKGWYKGAFNKENLKDIITKYRFMILYSNYEGFPFSIVESLSYGIPVIVRNTFLSAPFLCNKNTGLLLDKKNTIEEDFNLIRNFCNMDEKEWNLYHKNCLEFYEKNLSFKIFKDKWQKIFEKYLK